MTAEDDSHAQRGQPECVIALFLLYLYTVPYVHCEEIIYLYILSVYSVYCGQHHLNKFLVPVNVLVNVNKGDSEIKTDQAATHPLSCSPILSSVQFSSSSALHKEPPGTAKPL